jgi:hypothetical protein
MGAPAVAPRPAPARRAPARRAPARRAPARTTRRRTAKARPRQARAARVRPNPALAGAALIPQAAVSAAGAVRDISDSSLIVRLTAGRGWIAVLCALLGGIVALNVVSLSINATSGRVTQAIAEYERQNSALRAELAQGLSAGEVQDAGASLGMFVPGPQEITYVTSEGGDLDNLTRLLSGDNALSYETPTAPVVSGEYTGPPTVEPVESAGTAPTTPSATAPPPQATAPPVTSAPPSGGGAATGQTGGVGL